MKGIMTLTLMLIPALTTSGFGIEPSRTPIQTQMSLAIANSGWGTQVVALNASDAGEVVISPPPRSDTKNHSKFKAGLYSFLVPGWGQYYNGRKTKAKAFFAAEIVTWVTYLSLRTYGGWKKDDMIRLGESAAGADLEGKDDDFHVLLEIYRDRDQYNDLGRLVEPGSEYFPNDDSHYWRWQSAEDQATYRELREDSRTAYRRARWVMLVGLFDRVLAVVDAVRDARSEKAVDDGFMLSVAGRPIHLALDPLADRNQVALTFYPGF